MGMLVEAIHNYYAYKSALERSETLASLMQRLRASQECLAAVKTCLPPAMAAHV